MASMTLQDSSSNNSNGGEFQNMTGGTGDRTEVFKNLLRIVVRVSESQPPEVREDKDLPEQLFWSYKDWERNLRHFRHLDKAEYDRIYLLLDRYMQFPPFFETELILQQEALIPECAMEILPNPCRLLKKFPAGANAILLAVISRYEPTQPRLNRSLLHIVDFEKHTALVNKSPLFMDTATVEEENNCMDDLFLNLQPNVRECDRG